MKKDSGRVRRRVGRLGGYGLVVLAFAGCAERSAAPASGPAPEVFSVAFETSAGPFTIEFERALSPLAVDRVYRLAQEGFWEGARVYRVNDRYAQFGYSGQPAIDSLWVPEGVPDEPVMASNVRGSVSYARAGPGTRSAILFINRADNTNLDDMQWNGVLGFPPVGRVVAGMESVDALYSAYGDAPMQWEDSIASVGNAFLDRAYPELDSIGSVNLTGG